MDKFARVEAAVSGAVPDCVPSTLWFHFGGGLLTPPEQSRFYLSSMQPLDLDLLKVMFDYRPDFKRGLSLSCRSDLIKLAGETDWEAPYRMQREVLKLVCDEIGREIPVIETGFSPWYLLLRWLGRSEESLLLCHQDVVRNILERLKRAACRHLESLSELGVYGYFHATTVASRGTCASGRRLQDEHDHDMLAVASRVVRFLHLHGGSLDIDRVCSHAFEVLSYSDRDATNPDLDQARALTDKCLMGGICESTLTHLSAEGLARQIDEALQRAGETRFILSPGCSVAASIAKSHASLIKETRDRLCQHGSRRGIPRQG